MPSQTIEECWEGLLPVVNVIFQSSNNTVNLNHKRYMEAYAAVYNFCTTNRPPSSNSHRDPSHIVGHDMYRKVADYLEQRCISLRKELEAYEGVELLEKHRQFWEDFLFSRRVLNNIFMYINRHCVARALENPDHKKNKMFELDRLALLKWREHLFKACEPKLIRAMLDMVERDRNGEAVSTNLLRSAVDCLCSLQAEAMVALRPTSNAASRTSSVDTRQHEQQRLEVYANSFQQPFLDATLKYYKQESEQFLAENSISDYLKLVTKRVQQEEQRVQQYLHASTNEPLAEACNDALIRHQIPLFNGEIDTYLQQERNEAGLTSCAHALIRVIDLHHLYVLLCRLPDGVNVLLEKLEAHIIAKGREAIDALGKISMSGEDSKKYVEALLQVYEQFNALVRNAFNDNPRFIESRDKGCRTFVNSNSVTQATKLARSPELLAKYCDSLLKNSSKHPENVLENLLSELMVIFNYLDDKDVFEQFYKKMLANRLIQDKSASDDAEASMLSKLKDACGGEYTNKLQRMFQDMATNKQTNAKFKEHLDQSGHIMVKIHGEEKPLDFNVRVLTTTTWPFASKLKMVIPTILDNCIKRYELFYAQAHTGRKLDWVYHLCKGEILMLYTKKERVLEANTVQISLLLAFNEGDSFTMENFMNQTELQMDIIQPQLDLLTKAKILLLEDGRYSLNFKYNYKKLRVKIDQPVRSEQKADTESTHKAAEEDRKFIIQACIVRIMKTRKHMKHQQLMQETLEQLSRRFKPKVSAIKRNIESLIEAEYLRRREGEREVYEYLA
ncbi:uncharacterized protein MONBRDRAFT_34736 [Monosiga brevicollis MX1]|uniref:Cullin family profile domain-containing protein n=1 Tax=Monosiga brevicollis TaxID=81824 RepID=A9VDN7_MONBE|nr:uncharacterized protein MONBRDRAFT_34736 [Monosiga brevicollis MX1]EDQ84354.1 predicted protein [Monosiga brevicollis MX1]|eukprot:XP_001750850.1 hypothetical protein [Monosiga brevicollis MX1]